MLKIRIIPCLDVKDGPFARSGFSARTNKQTKAAVLC
jgi:imidazole glycerol phosphate synthase subunit HisF